MYNRYIYPLSFYNSEESQKSAENFRILESPRESGNPRILRYLRSSRVILLVSISYLFEFTTLPERILPALFRSRGA